MYLGFGSAWLLGYLINKPGCKMFTRPIFSGCPGNFIFIYYMLILVFLIKFICQNIPVNQVNTTNDSLNYIAK